MPQNFIKKVSFEKLHISKKESWYLNPEYSPEKNKKGFNDSQKKSALANYIYALMSSNSYENPFFDLDKYGWERVARYQNEYNGFSADIYKNIQENKVVIAFRGTEWNSTRDWLLGNIRKSQYASARDLVKTLQNKPEFSEYRFLATGHSLGGGLALHVSLYIKNIDSTAFDPSPRYIKILNKEIKINEMTVIYEKGEILQYLRALPIFLKYVKPDKVIKYNFMKGNSMIQHNMYYLARGLLKLAAINNDSIAREIMRTNLIEKGTVSGYPATNIF